MKIQIAIVNPGSPTDEDIFEVGEGGVTKISIWNGELKIEIVNEVSGSKRLLEYINIPFLAESFE